jgi:hypothetical protein
MARLLQALDRPSGCTPMILMLKSEATTDKAKARAARSIRAQIKFFIMTSI